MSIRHLHEGNEEVVEYIGLEFRGEDRAAERPVGEISI